MFQAADDNYNSGLFHFKNEKGRHENPDELTLDLDVDDKLLREILYRLYYPDSPYKFSVLPADILGQISDAAGSHRTPEGIALSRTAREAVDAVKRGVVSFSSV